MEIEYGLNLNEEREKKIRPRWESLLQQIKIIPFSLQCANASAIIRSKLKVSGTLVGPYDVQIAGTALAYNLVMVSSNLKEFKRITEIQVEDWRI